MKRHQNLSLKHAVTFFATLAVITLLTPAVSPAASISVFSAYDDSRALALSADGSIVTGRVDTSAYTHEAFSWTASTGMTTLGMLTAGTDVYSTTGNSISADGSVIAGTATGNQSFIWSSSTSTMTAIKYGSATATSINGLSSDGSTAVGQIMYDQDNREAFKYTTAGGIQLLGDLDGGEFYSEAVAASADGSVIAGNGQDASSGSYKAVIWTASGIQELGGLGANGTSVAEDISADGTTVVGSSKNAAGKQEAFMWTGDGMVGLGYGTSDYVISNAAAVSGDGSVVVGAGMANEAFPLTEAILWTDDLGMVSLLDYLTTNGADMTGWQWLVGAFDISADGSTVIGLGYYNGEQTNFIASLAPVPVPGAVWLLGSAVVGLVGIRRKLNK